MSESQNHNPRDLFKSLGDILGEAVGDKGNSPGKIDFSAMLNDGVDSALAGFETAVKFAKDTVNNAETAAKHSTATKPATVEEKATPKPAPKPTAPKEEKAAPKPTAPKEEKAATFDFLSVLNDVAPALDDIVDFVFDSAATVGNVIGDAFEGLFGREDEGVEVVVVEVTYDEPPVDIVERKDGIEFRIAVAGATSEDLSVELDGEFLNVTVTTPKNANIDLGDDALVNYAEQGIWSGVWEESFTIPNVNLEGKSVEIDAENVTASVKNGLATIVVPFKELVKATIKVS